MARRRRPPRAGAIDNLVPLKIFRQIVMLQAAYYFFATILIVFTTLVAGRSFNFDLVLSWESIRGDNTIGWTLGLCWILDSLFGVILLLLLVNRSKLIPDFALTIHFIHFLVVSLYTHELPSNLLWWGLQGTSAGLMIILGIWACQWRELQPLSFGGFAGKAKTTAALGPHELGGEDGHNAVASDDGVFFRMLSRVRRNTLGGDSGGRGDYELADMEERADEEG